MITIQDTVKKFHSKEATEQAIKELVKYHVTEALKAASEHVELDYGNGKCRECGSNKIDEQSILSAYPLNLIE
jgi:uncharacterized protein (UPF0212 family)